jgi:hypothetical protein
MVVTVEPGIYFNSVLLEPALKDPVQNRWPYPLYLLIAIAHVEK